MESQLCRYFEDVRIFGKDATKFPVTSSTWKPALDMKLFPNFFESGYTEGFGKFINVQILANETFTR